MSGCIRCGKETKQKYRGLEVQTLHVRDLEGEKRVQALGSFHEFFVCDACAEERLRVEMDLWQSIRKKVLRFSVIFAAGILLMAVSLTVLQKQLVFVMLSLAAMVCGVLGVYAAVTEGKERQKEFAGLTHKEGLRNAAWEVIADHTPSKNGASDLTYIPVDGITKKRKNGDLMILYHLLPEIAVEAYKRIHNEG